MKSYFTRSSIEFITFKTIPNEKVRNTSWNEMLMETPFWKDVRNENLTTYHQLFYLIQIKILKEIIEKRKKIELGRIES